MFCCYCYFVGVDFVGCVVVGGDVVGFDDDCVYFFVLYEVGGYVVCN